MTDRYTRTYKLKLGEGIEIDAGSADEITVSVDREPGTGRQVQLVVSLPRGKRVRKAGPTRGASPSDPSTDGP